MKNRVILLFLIFNIKMVSGQPNTLEKPLVISPTSKTTRVHQDENGEFNIDVHHDVQTNKSTKINKYPFAWLAFFMMF